ncbi:MAG: methyltransferase domain-containing protein [Polyangiaceae bacterium]|nr:methyltransferase domain-containing protein [Polyangiaceae bacterium]
MGSEYAGAVVKRLRREAKMSQGALAKRAGLSERWLRAWECGHREPSDDARRWVAEALAERLDRSIDAVLKEMGNRPAPPQPRKTLPIQTGGADVSELVRSLLEASLNGFSTPPFEHRNPSLLRHDAEGSLFLMERHHHDPGVADLRSEWVVAYIRWSKVEMGVVFDLPEDKEEGSELPDTGALPFVGVAQHFALPIVDAALQAVGAQWSKRDPSGVLRAKVLITPLCRERTSPSVPKLLSSVLTQTGTGGPSTDRDFSNWLELAQSLATALWSLHKSGWSHLAVSAENILLRTDHGVYRDITLFNVWDPGRLLPGEDPSRTMRSDLFELGATLLAALVGARIEVDPDDLRPPLFAAREKFRHLIHGEMNRRALNLCLRYLLEPSRPRKGNGGDDEPSTDDPPENESSAQILMKFTQEVGALRALHRRRGHARPPVRLDADPSGRPSLPPTSLEPRLGAARNALLRAERPDPIITTLSTLSHLAAAADRKMWCDKYIASVHPSVLAHPTSHRDLPTAIELLTQGHGRAAGALLTTIAQKDRGSLSLSDSMKLLRLLVGVLLPREGDVQAGRRVLQPFGGTGDTRLQFWVDLLEQRLTPENADPHTAGLPVWKASANPREEARARAWEDSHRYTVALKQGNALTEEQIRGITRLLHGESAHEAIYGALLLARAEARANTRAGLTKALRSALLAASYAATKAFPHEYAASLALGASFLRAAARNNELRHELAASGTDMDASLVIAAECDLQAAEIYQWLDVPIRCCQAFSAAAECFFQCEAPEWISQGFRWQNLAQNQQRLPWDPPDLLEKSRRELAFGSPRLNTTEQATDPVEDGTLTRGVELWWKKYNPAGDSARRRDPGSVMADDYYALYGPGIEWAFGTGGVSVELLSKGPAGDLSPRIDGTIEALFQMAEQRLGLRKQAGQRILDLGCGAGLEAVQLASLGFEVVGIDSSAWAVLRASERAKTLRNAGTALFIQRDPTSLNLNDETLPVRLRQPFDWVLLRDSLRHVVQKSRVINLAVECLKPGGGLIGSDWIQRRTASRWAWWRLFETVWYATIESRVGMERLLAKATPALTDVWTESRDDDMHAFFEQRLHWLSTAARAPATFTDEMAVRLRAQSDIAAMRDLSGPDGPVGWLFYTARRATLE